MSIIYVVVHRTMSEDTPRWAFTKKTDAERFCQRLYNEFGVHLEDFYFTIEVVHLNPTRLLMRDKNKLQRANNFAEQTNRQISGE